MSNREMIIDEDAVFLVTGGAGFIGSNLCEAILGKGHKVRCLDNFSTGKRDNIAHMKSNPLFELAEGDIRNYETCVSICENVDYVLHQAALGSVPESIETPLLYDEVNVKGTLNMLEAARQQKVKKFVYASSAAVYGDDPTLPKREDIIGDALSPYALTKRINEEYAKLYTSLYSLDTYGLRYFNVFGRRQNPDGSYASVIPKFIQRLLKDEKIVIHGDGMQSRDFVYVDDVVQANLRACGASHEASGQAYNVACGESKSILDTYKCLCEILKKDIEPDFIGEREGDIKHSCADISKVRNMLGYIPKWSFEQGIEKTIEWYWKI